MGTIALDDATAIRLATLDASLAALPQALSACARRDPWQLHDVRWAPGHGGRLAYIDDSSGTTEFFGVEVSGEEWGRYGWRDDTGLPSLTVAADPVEVARRLETVLGEPVRCSIEPVRYRPGSRCVLRYDVTTASGSSTTLFAKALQADGYARIAALYDTLAARGDRTGMLADVVAWWPDVHVVVGSSVGGTSASTVLGAADVSLADKVRLGHDLGELLARFHDLSVVPDATWSADQQVIMLADAMAAVECADPITGIRLGGVLDTLADTMPEPGPPILAHGSFRAGQVAVTADGRPVLLDVDEVRHSDRERDLGIALAHLTWQGIRQPHQQDALDQAERALLTAYERTAGAVRPDALRWWRTSGLVQVAARRFRRLEVGAWSMTDELAAAAESLLAHGRPTAVAAPDLLDAGEVSVVLRRAAACEVEVETAELLGVAPGRRSVVRYVTRGIDGETGAAPVIGKQFTHARSARLAYYHLRLLADGAFGDGPFRVPSPVGLAGDQGLLFYREDVGAPLGSLLDGPAGIDGVRSAAEWLARLHSSDLRLPRELSLAREVESTRQWAIQISHLHPPAAARAGALASRWAAAARSAAVDAVVPIHKDFHAGHVLIGEQTCVIDLDEARMGDPAFDVAHFCTYLDQLGAPALAVEEFVDAYSTATGWADKGSLAPFRAYTCLKIAKQAVVGSGPFRHVDLAHRLAIADSALDRGTAWVDTPWEGWA